PPKEWPMPARVCLTAQFVEFRLLGCPSTNPSHSPPQPGMEGSAMTYLRTIRQPKLRWIVTAALLASLTGLVLSQVGAADAAGSATPPPPHLRGVLPPPPPGPPSRVGSGPGRAPPPPRPPPPRPHPRWCNNPQ